MGTLRSFTQASPQTAPRKPTNLSLSEPLLERAKQLKINLSQAAEEGIAASVAARSRELWLEENREAIESSNEFVEQHGLPLARHRMF